MLKSMLMIAALCTGTGAFAQANGGGTSIASPINTSPPAAYLRSRADDNASQADLVQRQARRTEARQRVIDRRARQAAREQARTGA